MQWENGGVGEGRRTRQQLGEALAREACRGFLPVNYKSKKLLTD